MELYTSEEANFLIEQYSGAMVGNVLDESTGSIVMYLLKQDFGDGKFRVVGRGSANQGIFALTRSIHLIAKTQQLPSPTEVLEGRNKQPEGS